MSGVFSPQIISDEDAVVCVRRNALSKSMFSVLSGF